MAQAVAPDARVVYVDNDPIVLAHARALLTSQEAGETSFIGADLRQPKSILDHPTLMSTLDLSQPVAVMLVAVLMYFRDTDNPNPFEMVATLLEAMPSGSYLAITHPTADFNAEAMGGAVAAAEQSGVTLVPRSQAETEEFFTGLDVVDPGVTPVLRGVRTSRRPTHRAPITGPGSPASRQRRRRCRQRRRSSNSPSLTPPRNASSSASVKTRAGPSGWRELRIATPSPPRLASSTQFPWALLRTLLRHRTPANSPADTPLSGFEPPS